MENYEKKYKEALGKARELQENSNGMILKKWLWGVFPELKESEDERIRKEIIDFVKSRGGFKADMISWLEKQGEKQPVNFTDIDIKTWKYVVDAVLTEENGIGQYLDSARTEEIAKKLQKRFSNFKKQGESNKEKNVILPDVYVDERMRDSIALVLTDVDESVLFNRGVTLRAALNWLERQKGLTPRKKTFPFTSNGEIVQPKERAEDFKER